MGDSKDLSTWDRGAPVPQCLSELLERRRRFPSSILHLKMRGTMALRLASVKIATNPKTPLHKLNL
jgi:hypothetical protein